MDDNPPYPMPTRDIDPLEIVTQLRDAHPDMYRIFSEGCCFRFALLLSTIFARSELWYSEMDGHWIVRIRDESLEDPPGDVFKGYRFFDIGGELNRSYVSSKDYRSNVEAHDSAYVANAGNCAPYGKYMKATVSTDL